MLRVQQLSVDRKSLVLEGIQDEAATPALDCLLLGFLLHEIH